MVRRLVPEVFTAETAPDVLLVARIPGDPNLAGACTIAWRPWGTPPGFPLHVHVVAGARRRGVGRALVRAAARFCRDDTERFHGWDALEEGSPAEAFARALGFARHRRTLHFETELAACKALIDPIYARLRENDAIPGNARIVSLRDVPARAVARLVSDAFDSSIDDVLAKVREHAPGGYDPEYSYVLLLDEKVCGVLLQRLVENIPQVEVTVIAPALRCGWAAAELMREATHRGFAAGARTIRFRCEDGVIDTVNLARRVGARLTRTAVEYCAALPALL